MENVMTEFQIFSLIVSILVLGFSILNPFISSRLVISRAKKENLILNLKTEPRFAGREKYDLIRCFIANTGERLSVVDEVQWEVQRYTWLPFLKKTYPANRVLVKAKDPVAEMNEFAYFSPQEIAPKQKFAMEMFLDDILDFEMDELRNRKVYVIVRTEFGHIERMRIPENLLKNISYTMLPKDLRG